MFLRQSHDASVKARERSTESPLHLLRRSAPYKRMDATSPRAARNICSQYWRRETWRARSDAFGHNGVCGSAAGQAVGVASHQQESETHSEGECAIQDPRLAAAR